MIQEAYNVNELAKNYARRLLERNEKLKDRADVIIDRLIEGYPTHDYVINYQELKEILGSDVVKRSDDVKELWTIFTRWFEKYKDVPSETYRQVLCKVLQVSFLYGLYG